MLFFSCNHADKKLMPLAVNGVLDLRNWNFETNGMVTLKGPWKYEWMGESDGDREPVLPGTNPGFLAVPTTWKQAFGSSYGTGWLRLKVIVPAGIPLRLSLRNTLGAAAVYCNGEKILSVGIAGSSRKEYYPERATRSVLLPAGDTLNLAWIVSNFDDRLGGPRHAMCIGRDEDCLSIRAKADFRRAFIFGVIFIMSLYHILLWYRRRNDFASLFFGLFCFIMLIRHFATDMVHSSFIYSLGYFRALYKTEYLTLPFGCSFFVLFIARLFPSDVSTKSLRFILALSAILSFFALVTGPRLFTAALPLYELTAGITLVICFVALFKALVNQRAYSKLLLAGFIILSISVGYEMFITHSPSDSRFIISAGLVLFIFIQSIILSFKFADAYHTAEHLTRHLKEEVDLKTKDIRQKSSELEKVNLELKKADEYKTRFFQNVTHEFKTPLTLIAGPVQSILKGKYGLISDSLRKQLDMVMQNGLNTIKLVNQLLELARSDVKQSRLKLSKCNINDTLKIILAHFESLAVQNRITLSFVAENAADLYSYIDADKFERIFYNLLSNSFKFTGENGEVKVTLACSHPGENKRFQIRVTDSGKGIKKEDMPFIFDRFFKAYDAENTGRQGTGLGLALVKEYVLLHGASIDVESSPGKGTGFTLLFPLLENKEDVKSCLAESPAMITFIDEGETVHPESEEIDSFVHQAAKQDGLKPEPSGDNIGEENRKENTILVVEDNSDMRSYIREILKDDYHVLEAKDGEEGFQAVLDQMPDLIVSDVMMPEVDGIQFCKKIKTDIRTEHIPFILLTARSSCTDNIEGFITGADDYITKPFSRDLLLVRIRNLIVSRIKFREHYRVRFLSEPEYVQVESKVEKFISKAIHAVEMHIADPQYNVEQFAGELGISPVQLYRKLTSLIGQSPAEFIRMVRLKRAAKMLEESIEKDINVSEVAYSLGFANHSHFSQLFKKQFGISPTDYARKYQ
ncbi:MAG: response regulator [Bacteroidales bacterium]|nr:response regulator [Bacteroidales bacterium]